MPGQVQVQVQVQAGAFRRAVGCDGLPCLDMPAPFLPRLVPAHPHPHTSSPIFADAAIIPPSHSVKTCVIDAAHGTGLGIRLASHSPPDLASKAHDHCTMT